jgi:hypothetical protein
VKHGGATFNRNSIMDFDISSLGSSISSATLQLWGVLNGADDVTVNAFQTDPATWDEATTVFSNEPTPGTSLGTFHVTSTTGAQSTLDLTSLVQSEKALGHSTISIFLSSPTSTTNFASFNTREAASNQPHLVVT